ncbi:glycoside hydrolase family 2 TIM barrel-domain containing protein [Wenyingzhuangia sp. IMCC45533]
MKNIILVHVCMVFFVSISVCGQKKGRQKLSFNKDWKFILKDSSVFKTKDFDDSDWRELDLPHDWSIEHKTSKKNSGRNAWFPGGVAWYSKEFILPSGSQEKHVEIQFDGIYRHSKIWINGEYVGAQYDGYTSFYFDITEFLNPTGQRNRIAIRVDNSVQPNCRWYSGSGIYRNSWLTITDKLHIKNWGVSVTTPQVSKSKAVVKVNAEIENFKGYEDLIVKTTVYDKNKILVANSNKAIVVNLLKDYNEELELNISNPNLWSVDTPNMYKLEVELWTRNELIDSYVTNFGIRDIRFDADRGFFLNNKNLKIKGVCLHHEAGSLGAAVPLEVWQRRLSKLKSIGCNAIRTAHNPFAPEFLDLCDEMGFLVMDEFVDKWNHDETYLSKKNKKSNFFNPSGFGDPFFELEWQKNYEQTIKRDRNHPSVIIWSVGNENHSPGSVNQNVGLKKYTSFVRSIDSTRPVVSGMERGKDMPYRQKIKNILDSCQFMDLIALNYGEQWCEEIKKQHPDKAYLSTESYRYFNSELEKRFASMEKSPWLDVMSNDYNAGLFLWSGIDYLGESKSFSKLGSNSSLIDFAGFRREVSYLYQALWSDEPMVRIAVYKGDSDDFSTSGRWSSPPVNETWNLEEGKSYDLVTYTNCESVNLYLNNRKIGNKQLKDFSNWIVKWKELRFEPGTLIAKGVVGGHEVCEFKLDTYEKPEKIDVRVFPEKIKEGSVVQVEVRVLDKKNHLANMASLNLNFDLSGDAKILALENGNHLNVEGYTNKNEIKTNKGRCLIVLKVNTFKEKITLQITSKNLKTKRFLLKP